MFPFTSTSSPTVTPAPPSSCAKAGARVNRVRKRILANISNWPQDKVKRLRLVLKNVPLVHPEDIFVIERSRPHGHVEVILKAIRRLQLSALIDPKPSRERDLVVVRSYKNLTNVERAFRSLKTVDLQIRPIRHRTEMPVQSHLFLCLLSYYVEWHLRRALEPLLFDDEDLEVHRGEAGPGAAGAAVGSGQAEEVKAKNQGWAADPQLRHADSGIGDARPSSMPTGLGS